MLNASLINILCLIWKFLWHCEAKLFRLLGDDHSGRSKWFITSLAQLRPHMLATCYQPVMRVHAWLGSS